MSAVALADGPNTTAAQGIPTILFIAAAILVFVGVARLRGRAFLRMPRAAGWVAVGLAVASVSMAIILPNVLSLNPTSARPSSSAHLSIVEPHPGQVFQGDPAVVPIRIRLTGARISPVTSTKLVPDQGHLHVFLDGLLVSMGYRLTGRVDVKPGMHVLQVVYVALDHGLFNPSVQASARFRVEP